MSDYNNLMTSYDIVARHVYGYRLVFDGDADPEVSDYYANAQNQV
jgi:hypothetical protein